MKEQCNDCIRLNKPIKACYNIKTPCPAKLTQLDYELNDVIKDVESIKLKKQLKKIMVYIIKYE